MEDSFNLKNGKIKNATFVVGLPGIGNVGKIVTDFIIEQLNAKEIGKFYSDIPPMVFPTRDSVEFPSVKFYHANYKKSNFLFVAGDYQPREAKCFEFCTKILDLFQQLKGKEIIVLGGASLPEFTSNPSIYAIASKSSLIEKYRKVEPGLRTAHGNLGPIVGVAGVLLGLAKDKNVDATAFLTETTDKDYFNLQSLKIALSLINKLTGINADSKKFDLRIKNMDEEISAIQNFFQEDKGKGLSVKEEKYDFDVGYIG